MSRLDRNTSADDYGGSQYFNGEYTRDHGPFRGLTISDVDEGVFERRDGKPGVDKRLVLSFKEHEKKLSLNTTNKNILKDAFGHLVLTWIGKGIDLVFDSTIVFAGKAKGGVRVEIPKSSRTDRREHHPEVTAKAQGSGEVEPALF